MATTAASDSGNSAIFVPSGSNFDTSDTLLRRQGSTQPVSFPTSTTTGDYWWPYPADDTDTSTAGLTPITSTMPPILISMISMSSTSSSDTESIQTSSTTSPTIASSTLLQASSSVGSAAQLNTSKGGFKIIDLVPAFAVVGVFLLGLFLWVFYGCYTRKPRVRADDDELIGGPPYVGVDEQAICRDVEEIGQPEMAQDHQHRRRGISAQFRWPSFHDPPAFDTKTGFYVPPEYKNDDDSYFSASLVAPGGNVAASRTKSIPKSPRRRSSTSQRDLFRQPSNSTSIGLLDLYESDEEEAERRRKETPWESLRHKSIKRGILDQVKKENSWMNSLRSSFAEGSALLGGREYKNVEEEPVGKHDNLSDGISQTRRQTTERRRGHVRADSDFFIDNRDAILPSNVFDSRGLATSKPDHRKDEVIESTISEAEIPTPRGRRTFVKLKDDEANDKYAPLPTRLSESRSPSRSRSRSHRRSASPVKRRSGCANQKARAKSNAAGRHVLPQSPPQIMSPPLASQMCFTPIPPPVNKMPKDKNAASARLLSPTSTHTTPTKIPTAVKGKGRKLCSRSPPPLPPLPVSYATGEHLKTQRPKASRARLAKREKKLPAHPPSDVNPAHSPSYDGSASTTDHEDAMKKVDQIMEKGWNARDMGQEEMCSLSPNGFGRLG